MLEPQSEIVIPADTFELHAPNTHANTFIKPFKNLTTMTELSSKEIRSFPDHLV